MKITDLKEKKIVIAGLTGCGKTYLSKKITKKFKTLVYTPHRYEWQKENVYLYVPKDFYEEFEDIAKKVKKYAKEGKITMFMIDEFDLLLQNKSKIPPAFLDLLINHRHYGLSIMLVTRRIQNLPPQVYEECHYMGIFAVQSPNAVKKLNDIDGTMGEQAKALKQEDHKFLWKKQGHPPQIMKV